MISMGSMCICAWCITVTLYSPWHQDTIKLINAFAAPFIFRYGLLFDTLLWHLSGSIKKSLENTMGSSEKFSLKWNDFEKNVSKSFSQLRQQTGLFDVTLVSSDQKQVSAHRLVLSACSDFFKNIFHSNSHSHPMLYLDAVDSTEINLMLDYIYQGEVQIYQEGLNRFLGIAKKFRLDGLLEGDVPDETNNSYDSFNSAKFKTEDALDENAENDAQLIQENDFDLPEQKPRSVKERSLKLTNESFEASNSEVNEKFEKLVVQEPDRMYKCTVCNKKMTHRGSMKRHLETHLTGLSYPCQTCGKTYRSSNSLKTHKSVNHNIPSH